MTDKSKNEKIYNYIYLTVNTISNKKYIGKHTGLLDDAYIGSGSILKQAIKKYNKQNFKKFILEIIENESNINKAEIKWIKKFKAETSSEFYNLTQGGAGGNTLDNLSATQLNIRYEKYTNWYNNLSEKELKFLKKSHSDNMIKLRKDKKLEKKRIAQFKKTMESKSEEWKKERYKKQSGKFHYCARKVKTPLGIFLTASDAAIIHNVHVQTILNRCKNKNFLDWKFIDE